MDYDTLYDGAIQEQAGQQREDCGTTPEEDSATREVSAFYL